MNNEELLPCPFCKSIPELVNNIDYTNTCCCRNCYCAIVDCIIPIDRWNTRFSLKQDKPIKQEGKDE